MRFKFLRGKNHRDFVKMIEVSTRQDIEVYNVVCKILKRVEYMPFLKGNFDKHIEASYLFREFLFPYQFWDDVRKVCLTLGTLIPKENCELIDDPCKPGGYYSQIPRDEFDEWLHSLNIPSDISIDKEEYMYQQDSVFKAINKHVARISVATSGGKTFLTYLYCKCLLEYVGVEPKILIIVPSTLLCKQLKTDFTHYDSLNDNKLLVETIYSGSKRVADAQIVCGTYQSLCNYDKEYFDEFTVCICDELHRAKAYSIRNEIYAKITNADYFFGMTGTFPDYKTLDYLHIVSMFGPEVTNVTVKQLIDTKVANRVDIKSIEITYYEDREKTKRILNFNKILSEMPELCPEYEMDEDVLRMAEEEYNRENQEDTEDDVAKIDTESVNFSKRYYAEKHYFQSNPFRINIIAKLINQFDENSIIFVDTVEYCNELYDFLKERCPNRIFAIIHGSVKHRDLYIEEMKDTPKGYVLIATYGTMSTGVSIKNLTNAYIVDGGKSKIRIKQSLGRLMRILDDKNTSKIFDFYDNMFHSSFRSQARARLKIYKDEKLNIENFYVKIPYK